jgi:hypothetical protein
MGCACERHDVTVDHPCRQTGRDCAINGNIRSARTLLQLIALGFLVFSILVEIPKEASKSSIQSMTSTQGTRCIPRILTS